MVSSRDQNCSYANQICHPDAKSFSVEFLGAVGKRIITGPIVGDDVVGPPGALTPTETALEAPRVTGNVTVTTASPKTFRVQGIPAEYDPDAVSNLLNGLF